MQKKSKPDLGLVQLRKNSRDHVLLAECPNCRCKRYNPCGCQKKAEPKEA